MTFGEILLAIVAGYLIGSIPFGLLLTRAGGMGDIRDIGSGNIGATNVLRTGSKKLAVATLLLDMAKGFIVVVFFEHYGGSEISPLIAGIAAFVGHCFPVWLRFDGGKGVASFFGILAAWNMPVALLAAVTWIGIALVFRYSSLASLITVVSAPIYFVFFGEANHVIASAMLAALAFYRHRENIVRLRSGTESKIGSKSTPKSPSA